MKGRTILWFGILLPVSAAVLFLLQRLLVPKYMGRVVEGAFIEEYYDEKSPHDVIILGDCEVYENLSPAVLVISQQMQHTVENQKCVFPDHGMAVFQPLIFHTSAFFNG